MATQPRNAGQQELLRSNGGGWSRVPFGMQQEQSYKRNHINMNGIEIKKVQQRATRMIQGLKEFTKVGNIVALLSSVKKEKENVKGIH